MHYIATAFYIDTLTGVLTRVEEIRDGPRAICNTLDRSMELAVIDVPIQQGSLVIKVEFKPESTCMYLQLCKNFTTPYCQHMRASFFWGF